MQIFQKFVYILASRKHHGGIPLSRYNKARVIRRFAFL